ncbi:MAG: hypothetical protein IT336_14315 [Thermomicrobiales bacterium]|nr:hypothetical protein [Thermomicrobiales bacterium]
MTFPFHRARVSRRSLLARTIGATALATIALPGLPARAAREPAEPGERGVALLQAWIAGEVPKQPVPLTWQVAAPPRGAAFNHPRDWTVTQIADPNIYDLTDGNPFGTWAVSPDQSAGVLLLNLVTPTPVSARDAAWSQIEQVAQTRDLDPLADDEHRAALNLDVAFAAASADKLVCATLTMATPDTVMGGTYLYVQLVLAEADLFDDATEIVFLPMLQNLVTDGGSACDDDPDDDVYTLDDCPSA